MGPVERRALEGLAESLGQGLDGGRAARNVEVLMGDPDGRGILGHALGAQAYAVGDAVVFQGAAPDLHTAAHEAAHVIQQNQSAVEFLQQRARRP